MSTTATKQALYYALQHAALGVISSLEKLMELTVSSWAEAKEEAGKKVLEIMKRRSPNSRFSVIVGDNKAEMKTVEELGLTKIDEVVLASGYHSDNGIISVVLLPDKTKPENKITVFFDDKYGHSDAYAVNEALNKVGYSKALKGLDNVDTYQEQCRATTKQYLKNDCPYYTELNPAVKSAVDKWGTSK